MDTNTNEYEEFLKDPERLFQYLGDRIDDMNRTLNDDEEFCNKDIDATKQYVEMIEKKLNEKIQEIKDKLEQIRIDNKNTSEQNKKQFDDRIQEVNDLFTNGKHDEAWKKFKDCEKFFQHRSTVIENIPKLNMNETDIQQYFSSDSKPNKSSSPIQSTNIISSTIIIQTNNDKRNSIDDNQKTTKERLREEKIIDAVRFDKDNEEFNNEKTEQIVENSQFGIRSKRPENQQTITNNSKSPITINSTRPRIPFSTRLNSNANSNNLPFSGRNISETQSTRVNSEQRQSTPTFQRPDINLIMNPVSHYQHEKNMFLLMTCNPRYIVLFKSQLNRLDRWHLGAIERGIQSEHSLEWHDGLIISMGYISNNNIYMFTEREFFIYSISNRRKLHTRMLPHGNDDGYEITNSSSNDYQRGIGTVDNKFMYHIYLNRSSHWTLSKTSLDTLSHIYDYDLTRIFPDVLRFIHLCISEKTTNFLVQMNDLSYAVVFCLGNKSMLPIILPNAKQPLTIYSAYVQSLKCEVFFINDPSNEILHILTIEQYLQSYPLTVHAMCYVAEKHELMIVTNNYISSINLNQQNIFS